MAVGAIVLVGDLVLLIRRKNPPLQGAWTLPGGRVQRGERLADALRREVREETALEVTVKELVEVVEIVTGEHHFVIMDYRAELVSEKTTLRAGDDATDARFVAVSELRTLGVTEAVERVVEKAISMR